MSTSGGGERRGAGGALRKRPRAAAAATGGSRRVGGGGAVAAADAGADAEAAEDVEIKSLVADADDGGGRDLLLKRRRCAGKARELKTAASDRRRARTTGCRARPGFVPSRASARHRRVVHRRVDRRRRQGQPAARSAKEAKPVRAHAVAPRARRRTILMLPAVNEPMILHALRQRFLNDEIYTSVGSILVSVNPFKPLPLYTPSVVHKYSHRGSTELPPHVYALADNAYRGILFDGKVLSRVVSGESGAGKTGRRGSASRTSRRWRGRRRASSRRCCSQFLPPRFPLPVCPQATTYFPQVLLANPVLEAFGNAKTIRNNNSSRFGKLIDVNFDHDSRISSSLIHNYLLEKSRLVAQVRHAAPHSDLTTHPSILTTHPPRRPGAGRAQLPLFLPAVRRRRRRRVRPPLARPAVLLRAARVVDLRRH